MGRPIAIVGTGLVSCLGAGVDEVFAQLLAGASGMRPLTRFHAQDYAQPQGGEVPPELAALLEAAYPDDDPALRFIKAAATEALGRGTVHALPRMPATATDPNLGLVLATNFGLMETQQWCWRERLATNTLDAATFAAQQEVVARVAAWVGAGGPAVQLSLSCASGAAAVSVAREWLLGGRATRVLAIGYDALTEFCWSGLTNLRTISTDRVRPFDRRRSGTIFSEGAAAALFSTAPDDGPRTLAWLLGAATNNNAFHLTAPPKGAAGSRRVLAAALADAGVIPAAVALVSAHATATTANDSTEAAALCDLLPAPATRVPVMALKGNLGHLLGAAGLAEVVLTVQAMRAGQAPAVGGLEDQDPECAVAAVKTTPRAGSYPVAITNSAGIGGNNAAVVLGLQPGTSSSTEVVLPATVRLAAAGWVLPGQVGGGTALPCVDRNALLAQASLLATFDAKPYLQSVKGYLDPAGAYALAATALCLRAAAAPPHTPTETAVVCATQYGAVQSGLQFYRQFIEKGPRFASPLIFPHGYSNTASNLVAIEFGLGGPHLVLDHADAVSELLWLAAQLLHRGHARDVLALVYEAAPAAALPEGTAMLPGAICLWLTARPGPAAPWSWPAPRTGPSRSVTTHGLVHKLLGRAGMAPSAA